MGRFITFEGGEGTGKSTQCRLLAERLRAGGAKVVITREPGGSPGAEAIRHVLLTGVAKPFGAEAETLLFAAARDDHLRTTIQPALAAGAWVLCDRFADSTRVYQGVAGKVDARFIRGLERIVVGNTRPDLTCILDLPAETGLARAAARRGNGETDRFEGEALAFHTSLRNAYRALATQEPERCIVVDASSDAKAVSEIVWSIVSGRFGLSARAAPAETAR
jgi:dTMP kinase